jgi:hypothetical protein
MSGNRVEDRIGNMSNGELATIKNNEAAIAEFRRLCGEMESSVNHSIATRSYGVAKRGLCNLMATTGRMMSLVDTLENVKRRAEGLPPSPPLMPWEKDPLEL